MTSGQRLHGARLTVNFAERLIATQCYSNASSCTDCNAPMWGRLDGEGHLFPSEALAKVRIGVGLLSLHVPQETHFSTFGLFEL